ncbi:exodeoxyribonuclease VII small subunit [Candidatus Sumerlaeota bacterium]|nr:exodeoxyribonuclease VII small subunit [Candidatus Sumerlaeota bacterium]
MTAAKKTNKPLDFEKSLQRLEAIVEQLEEGELDLDKAIAMFEEGNQLSRACGKRLNEVEQRVLRLLENAEGGAEYEDFHAEDGESDSAE